MSYPILYESIETDFSHLGLGTLKDAVSCMVTEEINGRFQLEMIYPINGAHGSKLQSDNLIKADAGHGSFSKGQVFRIERVDKSSDGFIRIVAKHVSYLAKGLMLEAEIDITNRSAQEALGAWQNGIIGDHPFTVTSDINSRHSTQLSIRHHENARMALGGAEGSILDVWGGEFIFDNYHINLRASRGGNANTLISYGRNLTDLNQEENIANTVTSIYPFAIFQEEDVERIVTLDGTPILDSENAQYFAHRRVLPVDFSREFERGERPTDEKLRTLALAYLETHKNIIGVPQISIALSFVDLTKTLNQAGLTYERLNLCDTVPVVFEKLGIHTHAKVVRIKWDVLLDQYETLELGEIRQALSDRLRVVERGISEATSDTNKALTAANGKNAIFFGTNEPIPPFRVGDLWYRPNGEHTELWMWDGHGWKFIMSTAPDEVLLAQLEENRQIVAESNERVEQAQQDIDRILADFEVQRDKMLGVSSGLDTLDRELEANREAVDEANLRITNSLSRIDEINREMGTFGTNLVQNQRDVETALARAGEALTGTVHGDRIVANTVLGNRLQAGTITGDRIAGRTITANQLMVADMTNHATIDERIGAQTNVPSTTWGGTRFTANTAGGSIGGNSAEMQKLVATQQFLPFCARTPNAFRHNDEVFYSFEIWCSASRLMNFTSSRFTVDSGNGVLLNAPFTTTAGAWLTVSGTLRLNATAWNTSTFYAFGINDATASGRVQIAVRNVIVRRRNGGELIVDGAIQGNHIDANAVTARQIAAGVITANEIAAGTITGDRIAGRTITANQLHVADMTNHATINERIGAQTNVPTTTWGGTRFTANTVGGSIGGNGAEMQKAVATQQFLPFCARTANAFRHNDEVFYSFEIWCSASRSMSFIGSRFTADSGNGTHNSATFTTTAGAWLTVSGTLRLNATAWNTTMFYAFGINDATATGRVQIAVRNVIVRRRNGGELIVDGTIRGNHIDANAITAREISAGAITATEIATGAITADKIRAGAVTADKIATDAVDARSIRVDGTLTAAVANIINLDAARITTGTLNAARIASRTITANQLHVADMTNHATINERIGAQTNVPTTTWGGTRFTANTAGGSIGGNGAEIQKAVATQQLLPFCARTANAFRQNDEVFYTFEIWCSVRRPMMFVAGRFTADSGTGTLQSAAFTTTAGAWLTVSGTMRLTNAAWSTSPFYAFGVFDDNATGRVQIAVRNVTVRRRNGGELIVDGTIRANHIAAGTITANHLAANSIRSEHISTSNLDIRHYRFDGTAIGTVGDNDIIFRRGTGGAVATAQRDRLVIGQTNIRFYVEGGTNSEDGVASTGRNRIGYLEFNANRLSAYNMNQRITAPTTDAQRQPLRNIHIQPADKWVGGTPGSTALGAARGGGEVRCTYTTDLAGAQVYAPLRARRITINGQRFNSGFTRVDGSSARHLNVDVPNGRLMVTSDLEGATTSSLHISSLIVGAGNTGGTPTASTSRTDYRNGWCGTVGNTNFRIRRNDRDRILVDEVNTLIRGGNANNRNRIVIQDHDTIIRGGERSANTARATVTLAHEGTVAGTFNLGQSGTDVAVARRARVWSMPIYNRTGTASSNTLRVTDAGTIERITSASKYKVNIQKDFDLTFAEKILNVQPASWFDRANTETYASIITSSMSRDGRVNWDQVAEKSQEEVEPLTRIGGVIAEDVEAAGLNMYVTYGADGKTVEGVQYDRLWTLLIPLVKDQRERLATQETEIKKLKQEMERLQHGK